MHRDRRIHDLTGLQQVVDLADGVGEVVDKSLPFSLDVSVINILIIVFTIWVLYLCTLPSPRTMTMPDDD